MNMHSIIIIYSSEERTGVTHVQSDQCSTKRTETYVSGMCKF